MLHAESTYENKLFKSLDLGGKSLRKSIFEDVVFESCHFVESDWQQTEFSGCRFKNCSLSLINLSGCRLQQVLFEDCKTGGLDFYKCEKMLHVSFSNGILQTCNFTDLKLKKASFAGSKIREVYFTNADLSEANFNDTDLLGTVFHQCNLTKADFRNARNYAIDLQTNNVKKAQFSFPEAMGLLECFDIRIS